MSIVKIAQALSLIRQIPDFPMPGILFYDITPLLADADAFKEVIAELSLSDDSIDFVAGMEARGFIFASALALYRNAGFIPKRKSGKLPAPTFNQTYGLEYGTDVLEIHKDACSPESNVLIVDDVLATGGTACAAVRLVESTGAKVSKVSFVLEIEALNGRRKLLDEFPSLNVVSLKVV